MIDEKEECEMKGSGWAFVRVKKFQIRVNVYKPLGGSSFIPLPKEIENQKCVINVKNAQDNMCFKYAMLTRYVDRNTLVNSNYSPRVFTAEVEERSHLDFSDLTYPVHHEQISSFEKKMVSV